MHIRLDYSKAAPGSVQAMYKLQKYVDESGLDHTGQSSQLFPVATGRNAQFLATVAGSGLTDWVLKYSVHMIEEQKCVGCTLRRTSW